MGTTLAKACCSQGKCCMATESQSHVASIVMVMRRCSSQHQEDLSHTIVGNRDKLVPSQEMPGRSLMKGLSRRFQSFDIGKTDNVHVQSERASKLLPILWLAVAPCCKPSTKTISHDLSPPPCTTSSRYKLHRILDPIHAARLPEQNSLLRFS